jgi:hypothetical protein
MSRLGISLLAVLCAGLSACSRHDGPRFEVSFPASLHADPITGHMFVVAWTRNDVEPRIAAMQSSLRFVGRVPFFARDVDSLAPGAVTIVDTASSSFPIDLTQLPPDDYYVQAVFNVYTHYNRADGHSLWARQGDWDGQHWAFSPGNLVSAPIKVHLDPAQGFDVKITLDHAIPAIQLLPDTKWVKRFKMQSPILTKWWGGVPQYFGATVLLPKGYDEHPHTYYPVLYLQNHFTSAAPYNFTEDSTEQNVQGGNVGVNVELVKPIPRSHVEGGHPWIGGGKRETGYQFYKSWLSDRFPRMIIVTFQHPTQFFDDSYAVNSANNGPYGDAIMQELIPEIEKRFRIIKKPYARVLSGGSTGGWESLALQLYHPEFFGGTWTFFPDPIDFRRYQLVDIYSDTSYYTVPNAVPGAPERMMEWNPIDAQPFSTNRWLERMEYASGTHTRSSFQMDIWNAVYGPVGDDGYPKRLFDPQTGVIDHSVADYMRDHGYDLRYYVHQNWPKIGPLLVGKLHILCGDMDDFYLSPAVYMMQDELESEKNPPYGGDFRYGRPMKGHGWTPETNADLVREMAARIGKNAPRGEPTAAWLSG